MGESTMPVYFWLPLQIGFVAAIFFFVTGGWRRLARAYPATQPPEGKKFGRQSARIGWCSYNNCLVIHVSPSGIHLSMAYLFRLFCPPIFIPWGELRNCSAKRLFWRDWVRCDVGSPLVGRMTLPRRIFDGHEELIGLKAS